MLCTNLDWSMMMNPVKWTRITVETSFLGDRHADCFSRKQAANLIFFIMVENRNATLFKLCLATVSSMIWQLQTLFSDVKYTIVPNHEQDTVIFMAW